MNGKERILKTLRHESVDARPGCLLRGVHAGSLIGKNATEMLSDGQNLFNGLMQVKNSTSRMACRWFSTSRSRLRSSAANCTGPNLRRHRSRRIPWLILRTCFVTVASLPPKKAACR